MTYFFKLAKSLLLISIGISAPYFVIAQSFTFGVLNQDLKCSQEPQNHMEPGTTIPDSLTLPDSVTVPQGTLVYLSTSASNPKNQILYTIDMGTEKTLILDSSQPIPYRSLSPKKSDQIQKKLAKNINIIGIHYPNQPWVDFVCLINKKGEYLQNSSLAYTQFFQQYVYLAKRTVYLKESTSTSIISTQIPATPLKSHCQFAMDTTTSKSDSIPYITSLKKINQKNCSTPNYEGLLSGLKKHENLTDSGPHLQFLVIGVIDLDHDHINELIIEARGYESHHYLIYSFDEKWNLVYSGGGCGI